MSETDLNTPGGGSEFTDYRTIYLESGSTVPNNPDLPLILYRDVMPDDVSEPASAFEKRYRNNDWGGTWRNGIFRYHHYHTTAHEVLGIARGQANVMFGGENGKEVTVRSGDVAVLPAGTGHKNLKSSSDLLVIGGYPEGQSADLRRADGSYSEKTLGTITSVPVPDNDPLFGSDGPLPRTWET
ncbi:MAG: cupin domain-containing protein [bacterium]